MKTLRVVVTAAFLLSLPTFCSAQTLARYENVVLSRSIPSTAVSGAVVTVCQPGASGIPCSPMQRIYSDPNGASPLANPIITNSSGQYGFWISPGKHIVTINGSDLSPTSMEVLVQPGPAGQHAGSATSAANAFTKPASAMSIKYVDAKNGSDSNDGLSWGSAKATVYAALIALPGGHSSPVPTAGTGTVYLSNIANYGGPATNGGFWLMGSADPNYSSPPTGWLRWTGPLDFECGSDYEHGGEHGHNPLCYLMGGGSHIAGYPTVWLSNVENIVFHNIGFSAVSVADNYTPVRIGINSNNVRSATTGGSSGIWLEGVNTVMGNCGLGGGPGIDIGNNTFWVYIDDSTPAGCDAEDYTISSISRTSNVITVTTSATNDIAVGEVVTMNGNSPPDLNGSFTVASVTSDTIFTINNTGTNETGSTTSSSAVFTPGSFAVNLDPGTAGNGVGLVYIDHDVMSNGGVRYVPGGNSDSVYVHQITEEGNPIGPTPSTVLFVGSNQYLSANVNGVETADTNNSGIYDVEVDGNGPPDAVQVENVGTVAGPLKITGESVQVLSNLTVSPLRQHQYGQLNGRLVGSADYGRRLFGPTAVRFPNLAKTNPSTWTYGNGSGTITTGIAAPDGTTGAGQATSASGQSDVAFYLVGQTLNLGDYWIFGAWVRSETANGYSEGGSPIKFGFNAEGRGAGDTCTNASFVSSPGAVINGSVFVTTSPFPYTGDGEWEWMAGLCKVGANPTSAAVFLYLVTDTTHALQAYAPIMLHIPSGAISDNEAYELANNLQSYDPLCSSGEVCALPNQSIAAQKFVVNGATTGSATISASATGGTLNLGTNVTVTSTGLSAPTYSTLANCAANGTAANPSVISCGAASAGMFSCSARASTGTCVVDTTAVTANSEIVITQDAADGRSSQLNVTCNTRNVLSATAPILASKSAGTSFTINLGTVTTNPACFEYTITN